MSTEKLAREIKIEEFKEAMELSDKEEHDSPSPSPTPAPSLPEVSAAVSPTPSQPLAPNLPPAAASINFTPIAIATATTPATSTIATPVTAAIATVATTTTSKNDPEASLKRRESHRLVERRRRETINKGINDLALVVPDCPKKRSTVILKAIEHIHNLKQINMDVIRERDLLKEQNQLLVKELADKNKKINELLLLL